MINSIFVINHTGDVLLEKHYKSVIPRAICDYFFEVQAKASSPDDIPPVITAPHHYLISIHRDRLYYVAVVIHEVPPLFVVELLHRIADMLKEYFGSHSETVIKENYVTVFEIFDEMIDSGYPHVTESNVLREMIKPPDVFRQFTDKFTGKSTTVGSTLPTGQLSNIPWRRAGVHYTNNEAYFDIIEEIDAIIDRSGSIVSAEIHGSIDCVVRLSGMPDLTLTFVNARILDDVSFHPCVRFRRWEAERLLSFVPPDGHFRLISYHIGASNNIVLPLTVRHSIQYRETGSKIDLTVTPKQTMGKQLENVRLELPFPKNVTAVNVTVNCGKHTFDPSARLLTWEIGKVDQQKLPTMKGTISLATGSALPESSPTIVAHFTLPQSAVSGLRVNRLDVASTEKYKPFKGVKYITKAGNYQLRT